MSPAAQDKTIKGLEPPAEKFDGTGLKIAIVHTRWNWTVVEPLLNGCIETLLSYNVKKENILVESVPGSYELPYAAQQLAKRTSDKVDAIIPIGVLFKGSTMHFEYISDAVTHGLMKIQLESDVPVIYGVLNCLEEEQARVRAGVGSDPENRGHNHGVDWGHAAVEIASKRSKWRGVQ